MKRAVTVLLTITGLLALCAPAMASGPRAGVRNYNTPVCGRDWLPVNMGQGNYFNIYNSQQGNTCISVEQHHLAWNVTSYGPTPHGWQFPNISSGIVWGRYTCTRQSSKGPTSQCMKYPVRQEHDGMPVTSVRYWPHLANGNVAYDIWFNQGWTPWWQLRQNNGAEIMVWLDDPGLDGMVRAHTVRTVWVSGHWWRVMAWTMYHNDTYWSYVAYVAVHPMLSVSHLWLNQFFREAERNGELSKYWWLTSINFGSEINVPQPGKQLFAVPYYDLEGVN